MFQTDTISTISSPPSSSPVPSPRTDTVQYTACYSTQGDWHDMTCSPSNCTINTISPHTPFSPHHQNHQPPNVHYTPQFDYELNPNLSHLLTMTSPYNYSNPNMTFYNPYIAKSCKRALNTSGSSVGSRTSPHTKRPRHNLSTCSSNTNKSLASCCSLDKTQDQLDLDKTWVPADLDQDHAEDIPGCSNNNFLCQNCPDLQPVVAVCRSCPDQPAICQLCLDAHKRVMLTREHSMHMLEEDLVTLHTGGCRSLPQVLQSLVDLIDIDKKLAQVDLNDTLASTTAELVRTWSVASDKSSEKDIALSRRKAEGIIQDNLIPVFVQGDLEVKVKVAAIIQTLIEIEVVSNVSSAFANDKCVKGFEEMINTEDSEVILAALNCLQCLVKGIIGISAKFSMIKIHSQLEKQLRRLKDSEAGYTTSVQFKAGKLIREMEKFVME